MNGDAGPRRARWWGRVRALLCFCLTLSLAVPELPAQEETPPIHTLHVYADTVQLPVLVLGPARQPLPNLAPGRFSVSLDSGPYFRATHVRTEGDDPISLAVLLDASRTDAKLLEQMSDAVAGLVPEFLHERDHVTVYAVHCMMVRSALELPADRETLKQAVGRALGPWTEARGQKPEPRCRNPVHLRDAMTYAISQLYASGTGRRVLLAVTDGEDRASTHTWNEVRVLAQSVGAAIFGVTYAVQFSAAFSLRRQFLENAFPAVCELSGGLQVFAEGKSLSQQLQHITELVRGRYIVEFPRPANGTAGTHGIDVQVDKANYFVRPSGISVPVADPTLVNDPTTVPSDPTRTPTMGSRHVLEPKR